MSSGLKSAQVYDLGFYSVLFGHLRSSLQRVMQHHAVGHHRQIIASALDLRPAYRLRVFTGGHLASHESVGAFVFQEHHRIVIADSRYQQTLGIVGRSQAPPLSGRGVWTSNASTLCEW